MNFDISNHELFKKKLHDLKNCKPSLEKSAYTFECVYHGIELKIHTSSEILIHELRNLLPFEWIRPAQAPYNIFLSAPKSPGDFSDESSQDCFSLEENTVAIQRDFAASVSGKNVFLICEPTVGDGLYNFLRWFLSEKLTMLNKFVVHCSCVLDKNNEAHLFLGHSGAGKTTITELSFPRLVLGDDMNIISVQDGRLFAEAGAIGGKFNSMIGYGNLKPVKAVYWLKQDSENKMISLNSVSGAQKLLASFANLHWETLQSEQQTKLMDVAFEAAMSTSFHELHFLKDSSVWELIDP